VKVKVLDDLGAKPGTLIPGPMSGPSVTEVIPVIYPVQSHHHIITSPLRLRTLHLAIAYTLCRINAGFILYE
jgi:hypothetical protein